jgi:alanyl-tRNA synthetase
MASERVMPRTSDELRRAFFEFFESKGSLEVPSSSLIPADPTVLLTTAGMQQFVPYLTGRAQPPRRRLMSVQKCFRTTDIDSVGNPRNLTFFEMLGNFSIGDYFKREAIDFAWEFLTEWVRIPAEKLYPTVHPDDDESAIYWTDYVPQERIYRLADNWWGPPGTEGPCGPDTEIYFDWGPELGCGRPECAPGCDCDRFLEIWNLVLMQFFQDRDGVRTPLSQKNIDTGMGLERLTAVQQGVHTVYETDLFLPIMEGIGALVGKRYGDDPRDDWALRVIADHGRGLTFLILDGVRPANEGREYVLRRIMRRTIYYGRLLGIDAPFLTRVVDLVVDRMRGPYPQLERDRQAIHQVVRAEEERFSTVLSEGRERLERVIEETTGRGETVVDGAAIFRLYDTFGFPKELSEEILARIGLSVDWESYDRELAAQRERARQSARFAELATGSLGLERLPETTFTGYNALYGEALVLMTQRDGDVSTELRAGEKGALVLEQTPFYAEGGGQVGDEGELRSEGGVFRVTDTQVDDAGHILHFGQVREGVLQPGSIVLAEVDGERRLRTMRHHTVTHLLHRALKDLFGEGTSQQGSLVAPNIARFDFNYPAQLGRDEQLEVQRLVNQRILENLPVSWQVVPMEEAMRQGAVAMFGEKYGNLVRLVKVGGYSRELCGGTHAFRSGDLGSAFIMREGSAAAGIRRVEVACGPAAIDYVNARLAELQAIGELVGGSADQARQRVRGMIEDLERTRKEAERLAGLLASRKVDEVTSKAQAVGETSVVAAAVDGVTPDALSAIADGVRQKLPSSVVVLATVQKEKVPLVVALTRDVVSRGLDANRLLNQVAAIVGGRGGGRPDFAKGSGSDPSKLGEALSKVPLMVAEQLGTRE